jgi:hypothetical protein
MRKHQHKLSKSIAAAASRADFHGLNIINLTIYSGISMLKGDHCRPRYPYITKHQITFPSLYRSMPPKTCLRFQLIHCHKYMCADSSCCFLTAAHNAGFGILNATCYTISIFIHAEGTFVTHTAGRPPSRYRAHDPRCPCLDPQTEGSS